MITSIHLLIHLLQYLAAVDACGFIPKLLRIDRGGETTLFTGRALLASTRGASS